MSNYYAPPPVQEAQMAYRGPVEARPAGFAIRFAGRLIDSIAGMFVGFAGGVVGAVFVAVTRGPKALGTSRHVMQSPHALEAIGASLLLGVVGSTAYFFVSEWVGGATVGKLVLGLRVRDVELGRCTARGALIRNLAWYVDAFFFGLVAWAAMHESDTKQRLGDCWGRTVVVEASSVPGGDDVSRALSGIGAGLALWTAVAVAQQLVQLAILANP